MKALGSSLNDIPGCSIGALALAAALFLSCRPAIRGTGVSAEGGPHGPHRSNPTTEAPLATARADGDGDTDSKQSRDDLPPAKNPKQNASDGDDFRGGKLATHTHRIWVVDLCDRGGSFNYAIAGAASFDDASARPEPKGVIHFICVEENSSVSASHAGNSAWAADGPLREL